MRVKAVKFANCLRIGTASLVYFAAQRVVRFVALGLLFALGGVTNAHAAGYTASITTAYPQLPINVSATQVNWVASTNSCNTPSRYNLCDDGVSDIMPIGFSFTFAGTTYNNWSMSTNGVIFFETASSGNSTGNTTYTPQNLPTTVLGNPVKPALMPFWADLQKNASAKNVLANNDPSQPSDASFYQYEVQTVSGVKVLVVKLKNVNYWNSGGVYVNLQMQLWATGQIVYSYGNMAVMASNPNLRIGLQYPGGGCNTLANNQSASLSSQSYVYLWDPAAASCPALPTVNHFEIREDGVATLCAEPVTVLACAVATSPCPAASIMSTQIINAAVTVTGTGTLGTPNINPVSFNIQPSTPLQTVNLTWAAPSAGTATLGIQTAMAATTSAPVCTNAAGTSKFANCNITVSNSACIAPPHHYEVQGPASGSTCANNTFTIKAWADAAQTTAYTAALASGTLTQTGNPASIPSLGAFTIPSGSSTVNITPITFPAVGTTTFSTTATPALAGSTTCNFGGSTSCAFVASSATCVADFNCVETTANAAVAADSDPSTGLLYTKLAGTPMNFDVVARLASGAVLSTYASDADKTVTLELVDSTTAAACASYPNITTPTATSQSVSFLKTSQTTDLGRKTASFTVPNAYMNVRCRATDNNGVKGCSTDNFAIRPPALTLNTTATALPPPAAAAAANMPTVVAGANFTLYPKNAANQGTNYTGTLTQDATKLTAQITTQVATQANGGTVGTLTPATLAANPLVVPNNNATYSEVGYLYLAAGAYYDNAVSAFTAVDVRATPLSSDCIVGSFSDTLSSGKYGCNIGTAPASLGRFIPDHFATAVTANAGVPMACPTGQACPITFNGLVYSGQPYTLTVQAMNGLAIPAVTQNYMNLFAKAVTLGAFNAGATANQPGGATANPGGGALTTTNIAAGTATFTQAVPAFSNGGLVVPVANGTAVGATPGLAEIYTLPVALTAPQQIYIRATDTENITSLLAAAANSIEGGVLVAQGRINVPNLIGSEKLGLCVPAAVQYYTGSSWTTSLTDSATTFGTNLTTDTPVGNVFLASGTALITSGTTPVGCPAPASGTVASGVRRFRVASSGVTGSSVVRINSPAYLPSTSGTLFWGAYKSPVIDIRETFR